MYAQPSHACRKIGIAGGDDPRIAGGAEVLTWIKTETAGDTHRARAAPAIFRANCLCCIFEDDDVFGFCEREELVHVGTLAVEMDRKHHACPRSDRHGNSIDVDVVSQWIDVDKNR